MARGVLPPNTSIQKDATLAIAKSATVFISYLAHHANEQTTKKTIGPQDVLKALKEIEMDGVMELGAVGKDGRLGGRLEREMEAYEEIIQRKRKGYRDKVKARESLAGDGDDGQGADRGEPSNKKARRMSEEVEDDEEERMLAQQLNGTDEGASTAQPKGKSKRSSEGRPVENAPADGSDVEDGDEAEDEEDQEEEEEDDDDDEDDENDENEDEQEEDHDADQGDDVDGAHRTNGRARPLMVGRDVDVGSEDESD